MVVGSRRSTKGGQSPIGVIHVEHGGGAKHALRESAEYWRSLIENAPDFVFVVGPDMTIQYINRVVAGFTAEQVVGTSVFNYIRPDCHETARKAMEQVFRSGEPETFESQGTGPDGVEAWYSSRLGPVRDGEQIVAVSFVATDITERRLVEEEVRRLNAVLEERVVERTAELEIETEKLRESEAKFRSLAETVAAAIFIFRGKKVLYVNAAAETMSGYTRDELLAMDPRTFIHPDFRDTAQERGPDLQAGDRATQRYEIKIVVKNGDEKWVHFAGTIIDYEGEPGILGTAFDITERKRAEHALRESEERFRRLASVGFEGIALHENGAIIDANEAAAQMFGYELAEVVGMRAQDFMAPESHELMVEQIRATVPQPFEVVGRRKDGATFPLEIFSKSIPFDGRTVAVAALRNIAERKRAEEALRKSEERFRLLAEHARDIVFRYRVTEPPGYEYVSPAATSITGYAPDEWYADPDIISKIVHPDDREELQRAGAECRTDTAEIRGIRRDGGVIWVEQRSVSILDDAGSLVAIEGIMRDITDRKRAEEALQRARDELEAKVERQMAEKNPYGLTFRELTILHLVAAGRADKQIAREFGISLRTAQKHVANIRTKMKTGSRTEVGVRAIKEGLLE